MNAKMGINEVIREIKGYVSEPSNIIILVEELAEWKSTGILRDGKMRNLYVKYDTHLGESGMQAIEGMVVDAALKKLLDMHSKVTKGVLELKKLDMHDELYLIIDRLERLYI